MMKIVYVTLEDISLQKGSVTHVMETVTRLRKRGHHLCLMANASNATTRIEQIDQFYNLSHGRGFPFKVKNYRTLRYLVSSIFLFFHLFKILSRYDIIYARDYHAAIISFIPRLLFNKRLVFEINGLAGEEQRFKGASFLNLWISSLIHLAERIATKCADRIVSVTPQIRVYLNRRYHCPVEKIEVIGNGVDTDKFYPIKDTNLLDPWRSKLGIKKDDLVIGFVGNLAPWQGLMVLFESSLRLLSSKERPIKFLIVGEGVMRQALMKKVSESGFKKEYIFTGMKNYGEIPYLINLADVCVAPFIEERNQKTGVSPLKIYEYMACGKPVVASRIEGLEFVEEEGVGTLVTPGDALGFTKAINDILSDPSKAEAMGLRGNRLTSERFSWRYKVNQIENILTGLT